MTSKWRWQPVELPVVPTPAICAPCPTCSPIRTTMLAKWLYVVLMPPPWSTTMRFPPPYWLHPASTTTPGPAENTAVPQDPAKSIPLCNSPAAPVKGFTRYPNGDVTVKAVSGGCRPLEAGAGAAGAGTACGDTSCPAAWVVPAGRSCGTGCDSCADSLVTPGLTKESEASAAAVTDGERAGAAAWAGPAGAEGDKCSAAWAAGRAVRAMSPATTAAAPSCWPRLPRPAASGQYRPRETDAGLDETARRRPCWRLAGKMVFLSTPAKLAVGFGRGVCPALLESHREGVDSTGELHPKVHKCTGGGSSTPVLRSNGRGPPTGFGEADHEHTG